MTFRGKNLPAFSASGRILKQLFEASGGFLSKMAARHLHFGYSSTIFYLFIFLYNCFGLTTWLSFKLPMNAKSYIHVRKVYRFFVSNHFSPLMFPLVPSMNSVSGRNWINNLVNKQMSFSIQHDIIYYHGQFKKKSAEIFVS